MHTHRTTIELDEDLLTAAQAALGTPTIKATVHEALRRVLAEATVATAQRTERQLAYLADLREYVDADELASDAMWR